jgi:predicted amidohydrolase YtcJ
VETLDDEAVARLADLGLTASVQPAFDAAWGGPDGMYAARLGVERALRMNPFAALTAAAVPLAFGSDSPVTPFAPWEGVRAAVFPTRPEHRIDVRAAFAAHTRRAWEAARRPGEGELAIGAPATLAVWDARPAAPGLPDLEPGSPVPACLRTVVRGRVVYDAQS